MATELLSGSDYSFSPKLSPSPSPKIHLSPVEEVPYLPDSPSRAAYLHERASKRPIPYPSKSSPLEIRLANHITGRVCEPNFTTSQLQEHEEAISSGLSRMSFDTVYKAFKAVLASRKAARLQVATSLWQVEYSERMIAFNRTLHQENRDHLLIKDEQLKKIRNLFSERNHTDIEDGMDYIQAAYNDECEMLRAITAQADLMSRRLGPHAKHELLASTGQSPYLPSLVGTLENRDSITHALWGGDSTDAGTDTDTDSDADSGEEEDDRSGRLEYQRSCGIQL
ncbi:hypothetical protein EV702DRAFT_1197745 [Suillus placidus]|uniref:Uncharacterized protein n=1 Tax=Suillus placidus TaxID=48579 RepID=A0A9P6ZUM3_9AGAM|nr:hypothetical protein EV702DRAFT_1197745 [Suillus placidus]